VPIISAGSASAATRASSRSGPSSGGEKARLALALAGGAATNLLLLDEPTNHSRHRHAARAHRRAAELRGWVVVVSHDRLLINSVADTLLLVADGKVKPFDATSMITRSAAIARQEPRESRAKSHPKAPRTHDPAAKLRKATRAGRTTPRQLACRAPVADAQEAAAGDQSLARRRANSRATAWDWRRDGWQFGTALEAAAKLTHG